MTFKSRVFRSIRPVLPAVAGDLLELGLAKEAYLTRTGWTNSRRQKVAVDASGEPLPWYTYPAIRFLADRLPKGISVFEYGTGYSTLWWSRRASEVIGCEHDHAWFQRIAELAPSNVKITHRALDDGYARSAVDTGRKFDVIAIDGRRRVECARNAVHALSDDGIIVWDNSDRDKYNEGYDILKQNGFGRIDFWGIGPLNVREWSTAVFYRPLNCLGI
jgi:hypothetical protein